ncbi:MAG: carbon monoxide dehydrogenase [Chloroflexi bacterium]|nr:carbon monoxide dehydrogenase [Chloroflexota bacterium]
MKWVDYIQPSTLDDALGLLKKHGEKAGILAGGTDLLVLLRAKAKSSDIIVDIKNIAELNQLDFDKKTGLTIGAAVPCYKIYNDSNVKKYYPGIIDSASIIGGTQIQGRATLGGNLCNSAPSADAVPGMIAMGVTCKVAGSNGVREVPVEEFCLAPRKNILKPDEILVSLNYPAPKPNTGSRYIRFIPRNEMDIAVVGVGVYVELENNKFKDLRVSLASVAPKPIFVQEAGTSVVGKEVNEENINLAALKAKEAAKPITDMRGTIEFRKHLSEVLTKRALQTAIERAKESV